MARSIEQIIEQADTVQVAEPGLKSLDSPSQTAIYKLWKAITSIVINFLEQLWDLFKGELETTIANRKVGSHAWLKAEVLKFQYSATAPQVLQIIDFKPAYYNVDSALRIISRCSVKTSGNKVTNIKVAKSEPPEALSVPELGALISYIQNISFAGIQTKVISEPPDIFYLKASIYFDAQYQPVIESTVIAAIVSYLANLPFDGTLKVLSLEDSMQLVPGVTDIVITDVSVRPNGGTPLYLVESRKTMFPTYPTYAGYVIAETTVGSTLADQLTFISN